MVDEDDRNKATRRLEIGTENGWAMMACAPTVGAPVARLAIEALKERIALRDADNPEPVAQEE
jgi:hypothetical protein